MVHTMDWDMLQVFSAVARTGTLQGASKQLSVDRTTVGRRLGSLERRLGVSLFHRNRDGLTLTDEGHRALEHASRMETEARALLATATPEHEVVGTVRLAATEAMAPFLVEHGLLQLVERHPGLCLELLGGNQRLDLTKGEADLALRLDPLRGADLKARCVNRSRVAVFASRGYLSARGPVKSISALAGHRVVLPGGELAGLPEGRWLAAQRGVVPVFVSNSFPALVMAGKKGHGLVAVTTSWAAREPELQHLFDVPNLPPRATWLVSSVAASKRPAVAAVAKFISEQFALATRPA